MQSTRRLMRPLTQDLGVCSYLAAVTKQMHSQDRLVDVRAYIHDNCHAQGDNRYRRECVTRWKSGRALESGAARMKAHNNIRYNIFNLPSLSPHLSSLSSYAVRPLRAFIASLTGRRPSKEGWKEKALGGLVSGVKAIAG